MSRRVHSIPVWGWAVLLLLCQPGMSQTDLVSLNENSQNVTVQLKPPGGDWGSPETFPSLAAAQQYALSKRALHARFQIRFQASPLMCGESLRGLYMGFVYDQDRTSLNGTVIGATADPHVSTRRLSLVPRV
ncbi:MAG: hypothetical protein R3B54_00085 [Bdellovibrionota bacterium]